MKSKLGMGDVVGATLHVSWKQCFVVKHIEMRILLVSRQQAAHFGEMAAAGTDNTDLRSHLVRLAWACGIRMHAHCPHAHHNPPIQVHYAGPTTRFHRGCGKWPAV